MFAGCASKPPAAYRSESFEVETPFQFHSELAAEASCEKGRRALLSQGYEVDILSPTNVRGTKFFLPQLDRQMQLRITLVCLTSNEGSTIFANALQTRYELKSSGSSTGLSIAGVGSVSLPWSSDAGALTKVGDETVADPEFYRRLFVLIENIDK